VSAKMEQKEQRYIQRHSMQTRITHDIVAVACIWLTFSGLFVFIPALASAFPDFTRAMRVSHRIVGCILIITPIVSAILSPRGVGRFFKKYFTKWTPEDKEFTKKFVPYMLNARNVHMPDQDEVKSGQRFADGLMVVGVLLMAISGLVLWLGTSVWRVSGDTASVMRTIHDICFLILVIFVVAHVYLGAGIFEPYKGTGKLMWGNGQVSESNALYHWGFWARKELEKGDKVLLKDENDQVVARGKEAVDLGNTYIEEKLKQKAPLKQE